MFGAVAFQHTFRTIGGVRRGLVALNRRPFLGEDGEDHNTTSFVIYVHFLPRRSGSLYSFSSHSTSALAFSSNGLAAIARFRAFTGLSSISQIDSYQSSSSSNSSLCSSVKARSLSSQSLSVAALSSNRASHSWRVDWYFFNSSKPACSCSSVSFVFGLLSLSSTISPLVAL